MVEIKEATFKFLDVFWSLVCGYISLDVIPLLKGGMALAFSEVDNAIKICLAFAGLVYFILRIVNYAFTSRINYQIKKEELRQTINRNKEFDLNIKAAERMLPPKH
jgi:hypothetical protein